MEALLSQLSFLRFRQLDKVALYYVLPVSVTFVLVHLARARRSRTTRLKGPPSNSYIFGKNKELFGVTAIGDVYEDWEKEYGPIYAVPSTLGSKAVVLCDPKALAHFFSKDTYTYQQTKTIRLLNAIMVSLITRDARRCRIKLTTVRP